MTRPYGRQGRWVRTLSALMACGLIVDLAGAPLAAQQTAPADIASPATTTTAAADGRAATTAEAVARLQRVHVVAGDDEPVTGRLLRLGPDTIQLIATTGERRALPIDTVSRIDVDGDSVKNGALIGAAALGIPAAFVTRGELVNRHQATVVVALNVLYGALLGAGIDALHRGRTSIYKRDAGQAAAPAR